MRKFGRMSTRGSELGWLSAGVCTSLWSVTCVCHAHALINILVFPPPRGCNLFFASEEESHLGQFPSPSQQPQSDDVSVPLLLQRWLCEVLLLPSWLPVPVLPGGQSLRPPRWCPHSRAEMLRPGRVVKKHQVLSCVLPPGAAEPVGESPRWGDF